MRVRSQRGFTLVELMVVVTIIAILSAFTFAVATRPYTANAGVISEQLVSTFSYARMRAVSTRKVHRVTLYTSGSEQLAEISAASTTGMSYSSATVFQPIEVKRIPNGALIWSAAAGAVTTTGANPTQDVGLPYDMYFKPDGSATASTIYVRDRDGAKHYYRVLVYHATGSSYARETW